LTHNEMKTISDKQDKLCNEDQKLLQNSLRRYAHLNKVYN